MMFSFPEKGAIGVLEQNGDRHDDTSRLYAKPILISTSTEQHAPRRSAAGPRHSSDHQLHKEVFLSQSASHLASTRITTEAERSLHVAVGAL